MIEDPSPRPNGRLRRLRWIAVVIGLVLSLIASASIYGGLREELRAKSRDQIDQEVRDIQSQFAIAQSSVLAMAVYFTVERRIPRDDFERFAKKLEHPSALRVLQYIEKIPADQRALFEAKIRREGFSDFHMIDDNQTAASSTSQPAGASSSPPRDFYLPVVYVWPLTGNRDLRGVDLAADPAILRAIRRAADAGTASLTVGHELTQGSGSGDPVVSIFVPVIRGPVRGFDNLTGLAAGAIDLSRLVAASTKRGAPIVALVDITRDRRQPLWARSGYDADAATYRDVKLLDRTWRVYMIPPVSNRPILFASLVFGLGGLFVLLIVALSNQAELQEGTRIMGLQLDEQRADLVRSEATYRNLFYNAATANCELDAQTGRFIRVNDRMCEMTGYSEPELLSLTVSDITYPEDRGKTEAELERLLSGETDGFVIEKRYLSKNGQTFWGLASVRALRDEAGRVHQLTKVIQDITDHKAAEATKDILLRELAHRVRNNMQLVASLANQTARSVHTVTDYQTQLLGRLRALSSAQDALFETNWSAAKLERVVESALAPFRTTDDAEQWDIVMPDVDLTAQEAQTIALAIHELATNAVRFGALSRSTGSIRLHADVLREPAHDPANVLKMTWTESGGPAVSRPERTGFGSIMLEQLLAQQHGGKARIEWLETGLRFEATLPLSDVRPS